MLKRWHGSQGVAVGYSRGCYGVLKPLQDEREKLLAQLDVVDATSPGADVASPGADVASPGADVARLQVVNVVAGAERTAAEGPDSFLEATVTLTAAAARSVAPESWRRSPSLQQFPLAVTGDRGQDSDAARAFTPVFPYAEPLSVGLGASEGR